MRIFSHSPYGNPLNDKQERIREVSDRGVVKTDCLAVDAECFHQLGEGIAATVLGDGGARNGELTLMVLRLLRCLHALDHSEPRLTGALALDKSINAMHELAVIQDCCGLLGLVVLLYHWFFVLSLFFVMGFSPFDAVYYIILREFPQVLF